MAKKCTYRYKMHRRVYMILTIKKIAKSLFPKDLAITFLG